MNQACLRCSISITVAALTAALPLSGGGAPQAQGVIPEPLANHPGNIYLENEDVSVVLPRDMANAWRLYDYEDQLVCEGMATNNEASLGQLPAGFYRIRDARTTNGAWISVGVLKRLKAPTPKTSPVALDVAMSWFYPKEKMEAVANLCALAGVNWVRDRLNWAHLEPRRGQFAGTNQYDAAALAQSVAGLQILQVNHISPPWANPNGKRFPTDLRDAYRFYREMAWRWRGQVRAYEPWNEADITVFGGHTGSEMASLQKAACLGLKAWNPEIVACLNVFAKHGAAQLEDLHENEAWPYFDTFNLHHYEGFDRYSGLYADFRAVSAGKPLWVSECALPVKWAGDDKLKEPTGADLRVQAERVAKTYALSIHEGSAATFYFLLPHYVERQTQFGILRPDLTPRPAYVALAAAGRLMAGAQALGKIKTRESQHAFVFKARADGEERELVVAWENEGESILSLPVSPQGTYDHLGRSMEIRRELKLGRAPVFALVPKGTAKKLERTLAPPAPPRLKGKPCPIVMQSLWPEQRVVLDQSAYWISAEKVETIPVWIYNFSAQKVKGTLRVAAPTNWKVDLPRTVELEPDERKELALAVDGRNTGSEVGGRVRITGDFGRTGKSVLSLRLITTASTGGTDLPGAAAGDRWRLTVSGNGKSSLANEGGRLVVEAEPQGQDRWVYPELTLAGGERPGSDTRGLGISLTLLEGEGQFRAILQEENGSAYVANFLPPPKRGETLGAVAFFEGAVHGQDWSKPDPNRRLDPERISVVKIGCNTSAGKVRFAFGNLRWMKR